MSQNSVSQSKNSTDTSKPSFHYQGFATPNGTIVPDDVFDVLAPELTEAELRVLLYIIRRTLGFKKSSDTISLKQMVEGIVTADGQRLDKGAGIAKSAATRAVKGLVAKGIIRARRNSSLRKGDEPTTYTMHFQSKPTPVSSKRTRGGSLKGHPRVLQENTQQTVLQQTDLHSNISKEKMIDSAERTHDNPTKIQGQNHTRGLTRLGDTLRARSLPEFPRPSKDQLTDDSQVPENRSGRQAGDADPSGLGKVSFAALALPLDPLGGEKRVRPKRGVFLQVERLIAQISEDLEDARHLASNVSQALNLLAASGLSEAAFVDVLYLARGLTLESKRQGTIRGAKAAYFFSTLKDKLGINTSGTRRPSLAARETLSKGKGRRGS